MYPHLAMELDIAGADANSPGKQSTRKDMRKGCQKMMAMLAENVASPLQRAGWDLDVDLTGISARAL
jgi:hypothetical protein